VFSSDEGSGAGEADPDEPAEDDRDGPERADGPGSEPPAELKRAFWVLVAVVDAALLALALGVLLIAFRGEFTLGGALLVAGGGLAFYARERYRTATGTEWDDPPKDA
jgi:hypothetical protein